jgi:Fur family ferric uptake transcriptional regulator
MHLHYEPFYPAVNCNCETICNKAGRPLSSGFAMAAKMRRKKPQRDPLKRKTTQRDAIQEVFRNEDRPLAVEEILQDGRRMVESLNQATVYRNLKILVEKGWLRTISIPGLGTLYERAGKGHHHHFQCRSCDRLYELPGCALKKEKSTPPGFVTEGHEVFLFGICSSCRG